MDPLLMEILSDGVTKYLTGTRKTKYILCSKGKKKPNYLNLICEVMGTTPANKAHVYWQLQRNQEAIGWDNLLHGKFAKDWRKLNGEYNRRQNKIEEKTIKSHRAQEKIQEDQERKRGGYWDPLRSK